jgi:sigma-B regulation protein RsbU (phosphoserine phosphatase)
MGEVAGTREAWRLGTVAVASGGAAALREQLLDRRRRLEPFARDGAPDVASLLAEVDAALARMEGGTYGVCEGCHGAIEPDRLGTDPLARLCLDCLSPEQRRALEYDLELARGIQADLLPAAGVASEGWAISYHYGPLGPVSGDYCDVIPGEAHPDQALVLLGDVAGKGVAASLLMASLHAIFRSLGAADLPLADLVERANRLFGASAASGRFATLACGRISGSGEVEIANAGHCPPLLRRGAEVESLPPTGLPLGLFSQGRCTTLRRSLAPGDALLLYSDGLTEASSPSGEEYGVERAARLLARSRGLRPRELVRALLDDLAAFQGGTSPSDDLTLLVLERS